MNEKVSDSQKKEKKRLGVWLPYRDAMTSVSYEQPGMLLKEVRDELFSLLRKNASIDLHEVEDFRKSLISCGRPIIGCSTEPGLDAFVWFGEIGRDYRREHNLEMLRAIAQNAVVINSPIGYETAMDKFQTSSALAKHNIPVPNFILFGPENADNAVKHMVKWGGPVLVKPRLGSYGVGIMKLERPRDVLDILDYSPPSMHYVEQFIPNDPAEWIGINIIGGHHAFSYRKGPESIQDGWRVLDRKRVGGNMVFATPSNKQLEIAKKIAEVLDMAWVGVDIVTDSSGNPYVIDVNAFPGLYPEMYKLAGVDVPRLMANAISYRLGGTDGI